MTGTTTGGLKAAKKNKKKDPDFYRKIGSKASHPGTGGFACQMVGADGLTGSERASKVGAIGGAKSRRSKHKRLKVAVLE